MKYIIVIVLIILFLLVFLMIRRKKKNSNKTSSNIILSAVNPTSCYDTKDECDVDCRGYRCSENCNRSSTQCQEGETGCYGSEETCKSSCTPVYRCSVSGVVKEYKACAGESGCYTGESQANANCVKTYSCDSTNGCNLSNTFGPLCATGATNCYNSQSACSTNCVKTYSCAGSGPTGMTGCNLSNTFGPPCASGATNCYNSSISCTDACKGYRCSNCATAGAKCGDSEPNCYPTSAACSTGAGSCPMSYRCDDNCTANRTPCTSADGGKCFTSQNDCQRLCQATYRCTPDKKCQAGYISCNTGESGKTCFTDSYTCRYSLDTNCQKGYRCSAKCAPERMCDIGEPGCEDTQQLCITNCKGYRCGVNCAEGQGCTPEDSTCYISPNTCKTGCTGYKCINLACVQDTKCSVSDLDNRKCFTTANCLNECGKTVFDRINANEDIFYKIVNNTTQRQMSSTQPASGNGNWLPTPAFFPFSDTTPNSKNPDMFWKIRGTTSPEVRIISYRDTSLVNATFAGNNDGHASDGMDAGNGTLFTLLPVDEKEGTFKLRSSDGYLAVGSVSSEKRGNGDSYGNGCGESSPCMVKFQWNPADQYAVWKIIPYKNGVRI
jgi:hypothetical protein